MGVGGGRVGGWVSGVCCEWEVGSGIGPCCSGFIVLWLGKKRKAEKEIEREEEKNLIPVEH